jgi:uncharacterized membrane protein
MTESGILFQAVLVPHRSLSPRGLRTLLLVICAMCGASASMFVWLGAWPVGGFTGVELLLAALLFRLNARSARASEMLLLTRDALRIVRTDPRGRRSEVSLAPGWMSVRLQERPGRVPALFLATHGREEEIAAALGEAEKRDLEQALTLALHRFRNPVFDNPQLRE